MTNKSIIEEAIEKTLGACLQKSNSKLAIQTTLESAFAKVYDSGFCDGQEDVLSQVNRPTKPKVKREA